MITPYHIVKDAIQKQKKNWKELLIFSFVLSLTATLATLVLFIQTMEVWGAGDFAFTILYGLLTFNALFLFINIFTFLIRKSKSSLKNLFGNFRIKIVFHLILLSIMLITIFSLCYVFPNLILGTIAEIIGPGIMNLLLFATNIIIMGIGLFLIIYLNFAHLSIIDESENSFSKIINKTWFLVKGNWWSVFFNRAALILFNLGFSYLMVFAFARLIPIQWIETLFGQYIIPTPLMITFLLSALIFSTILIFINLPYESSFYDLYREAKKKE